MSDDKCAILEMGTRLSLAFPLLRVLVRVLKKVQYQSLTKAIVIVPLLSGQPWLSLLMQLLISEPMLLRSTQDLSKIYQDHFNRLVLSGSFKLSTFFISRKPCKQRGISTTVSEIMLSLKQSSIKKVYTSR